MEFEDGFGINVDDALLGRLRTLDIWPDQLLRSNHIGSVLSVLTFLVRDSLSAMCKLAAALVDGYGPLPDILVADHVIFLRSSLAAHLTRLDEYQSRAWFKKLDRGPLTVDGRIREKVTVPVLIVERGVIAFGGLILLLLLESVQPFRRGVESRWRRYAINLFIAGSNALLLSVVLGGVIIAGYHSLELRRVGIFHRLGISSWWNMLLTVVLLDGMIYLWHRAYHRVPFMWRMHRAHHSDLDLDVTTSGRFHLTEMVLSAAFRFGVIALLGANVASVIVFEVVFGMSNQLEHANLRLPPPIEMWLRWIIVTPDMHRVHHSQAVAETNSNYSTIFSFWDRFFGTYRLRTDQEAIVIGLPEYRRPEDVALGRVLAIPFGPPCGEGHRLDQLPSPVSAA